MKPRALLFSVLAFLPLFACSSETADPSDDGAAEGEDAYTSASAKLLDFEFDGEVLTAGGDAQATIRDQMLFTIGQLNGKTGVGRLDKLTLSNVQSTPQQGGLTRVTYHAKLPVSMAKTTRFGRTYTLLLPKRADWQGQEAFYAKYSNGGHGGGCVDWGAHDMETGIFWYYYRPEQQGCTLAADDVVKAKASVKVSPENQVDKYPEYDKVWSDDRLEVIAIFGKVEAGTTTEADRGIWSHHHFVDTMKAELPNAVVTEGLEANGMALDVTIESTLANGKKVKITSFLVDAITQVWPGFQERYETLTKTADVIAYNGHAGLGQNVRALSRMGKWAGGKYQIVYMNGCDTFAYVDGTLAQERARLNPDDPTGTKYMEILTNSMPPNWDSLPNNTMSLVRDLMKTDAPVKYSDLLSHFDQSGFVTVTGDEDNVFKP